MPRDAVSVLRARRLPVQERVQVVGEFIRPPGVHEVAGVHGDQPSLRQEADELGDVFLR
jgi:hypothetical protein